MFTALLSLLAHVHLNSRWFSCFVKIWGTMPFTSSFGSLLGLRHWMGARPSRHNRRIFGACQSESFPWKNGNSLVDFSSPHSWIFLRAKNLSLMKPLPGITNSPNINHFGELYPYYRIRSWFLKSAMSQPSGIQSMRTFWKIASQVISDQNPWWVVEKRGEHHLLSCGSLWDTVNSHNIGVVLGYMYIISS